MSDKIKKFIHESNKIERVYSEEADEEAYRAWKFLENFNELTISRILEIHRLIMKTLNPKIAGKFRNCSVRVGRWLAPNPGSVRRLIFQWLETCNDVKTEEEIKKSHIAFEKIHPFEDGNGRVGRIIYNWQRVKAGLPIHIIHEGEEQLDYYRWFE